MDPERPGSRRDGRLARLVGAPLAIASLAALVALACAPLRHLSPDEAYYLCASRARWPIDDHPPLLGLLLTAADALPGPIELRVRLVSIALAFATALGLARISASGSRAPAHAATAGAVLGALGLLPMAGALIATPDAPMLAALAWLLVVTAEDGAPGGGFRPMLAGVLACAATLSKVSALALTLPLAIDLIRRPATRATAQTIALGTLAALPFARRSLVVQAAHVAGLGPAVSAPEVGALAALGALLLGQVFLYGPAVVPFAARRATSPDPIPRGAWIGAGLLAAAAIASAVVSGRPPEPNWLAPAGLLLLARAARALGDASPRTRGWVLGSAVAPTVVALALWASPRSYFPAGRDPLARVSPRATSPMTAAVPADAPRYARAALACVYLQSCVEIRTIFMR
jgi:hypothetical protein